MTRQLVYVIADYGDLHDLAFAEVTQSLYAELGSIDAEIKTFAVPAFDTVATGFALAQTAINSRLGIRHKFYVNTAPRKDDLKPRIRSAGEGLAYARLHNGVEIVAVNSGYSLSFIKPAAETIRAINVSKEGSQFRSRDVFPPAFGRIAHGDYNQIGEDIRDQIPDMPTRAICYTDGYGNIKLSVSPSELAYLNGQDIGVSINGIKRIAKVTDGIFAVADGQLCIAPGSSGWTLPDGKQIRCVEIVLRGGSAAREFNHPSAGITVEWII